MSLAMVHVTKRALLDLKEIRSFSEERWGKRTASEYLQKIDQAIQLVQRSPGILRTKRGLPDSFYIHRVEKHFLVFAKLGNKLFLITATNLPERLHELEPTLLTEARLLAESIEKQIGESR